MARITGTSRIMPRTDSTVEAAMIGAVVVIALFAKARAEERFLSGELGAAYAAYRRRVPMLIPFWPKRG